MSAHLYTIVGLIVVLLHSLIHIHVNSQMLGTRSHEGPCNLLLLQVRALWI